MFVPGKETKQAMKRYYNDSVSYLNNLNKHRGLFFGRYIEFISGFINKYRGKGRKQMLLEVGCGDGFSSHIIAKKFPWLKVVGIDLSSKFIDYAKHQFRLKNLSYKVQDSMCLCFKDQTFDFVVSHDVIEHIPDVGAFLRESSRILKKKGIMIINSPNTITPLAPLKDLMLLRVRRPYSYRVLDNVPLFFYNLKLTAKKTLSGKADFTYKKPILDDSFKTGGDMDGVYLANPIDLKRYFGKKGFRILNVNFAVSPKEKALAFFLRDLYSMGFVVQKVSRTTRHRRVACGATPLQPFRSTCGS